VIDLTGLGDEARAAVARAETVARELGLDRVGTEHLLLGLLAGDSVASRALLAAGATRAAARHKVAETVASGAVTRTDGPIEPTSRAARAIGRAHRFSHHAKAEAVGADHLLLGVLDVEGTAGQVLRGIGVDVGALRDSIPTAEPEAEDAPGAPTVTGPPPSPGGAACPRCQAEVDALTFRVVPASDADGRTGEAVVFSCRTCGTVLGVSRAKES
jgi:ATP-dependent Clp protease ATP-binding subunit ClpC